MVNKETEEIVVESPIADPTDEIEVSEENTNVEISQSFDYLAPELFQEIRLVERKELDPGIQAEEISEEIQEK